MILSYLLFTRKNERPCRIRWYFYFYFSLYSRYRNARRSMCNSEIGTTATFIGNSTPYNRSPITDQIRSICPPTEMNYLPTSTSYIGNPSIWKRLVNVLLIDQNLIAYFFRFSSDFLWNNIKLCNSSTAYHRKPAK